MTHQSDSSVQKVTQIILLKEVAKKFGVEELKETTVSFGKNSKMKFDALLEKNGIVHLFEVFTRLDKPKAAQDKKVKTDVLKMWGYKQFSNKECCMNLVFPADHEKKSILLDYYTKRNSWICDLIEKLGIKIHAIQLNSDEIKRIQEAVKAQGEGMKKAKK